MTEKQEAQQAQDPGEQSQSLETEVASQWKLMWWKFRKHKLAMVSAVIIILFYIVAAFAEFFAPVSSRTYNPEYVNAPPQVIHFFRDGKFRPSVDGLRFERDPQSFKKTWTVDEEMIIPVGLFVKGQPYELWGLSQEELTAIEEYLALA